MDTKFFLEALRIWQNRNQIFKTWDRLTQVQRSAVMADAQTLKTNANKPFTIEEILSTSAKGGRL